MTVLEKINGWHPDYAIVDSSNVVVNIIEWDGESEWYPPSGCTAIEADVNNAKIGDIWDGTQFTSPE